MSLFFGCEGRNPAQIGRERHGQPAEQRVADEKKPAAVDAPGPVVHTPIVPANRPVAIVANNPAAIESSLKQINLARARQEGRLSVQVNDPRFPSRLDPLFDGDSSSLSRTEDINPLILIFTFVEPIQLKTVRIYPSYSMYDWILYPQPEGTGLIIKQAPEEEWSRIDLPAVEKTREVRIEIRRLLRDNFVHINEIEFYSQ